MSNARRLRASLYAVVFSLAVLACSPHSAAQNTGTIVVPAPPFIISNTPGVESHQAEQDPESPEFAYDPQTGQSLKWDAAKKSWVDQKTGEALGFDGKLASDGTIVPATPAAWIDTGDGPKYQHLATQDINNPEIAHGFTHSYKGEVAEPGGLRYHWDRAKNSWVDDDTGNEIGFNGYMPPAPQETTGSTPALTACPTQEECDRLKELYMIADKVSVAAGQTLIQATADRDRDLAQAAQLDKSASHRGDPDVSKAEQQQAQGLRDKLPNAQSNYNTAYKATTAAWDAWQDCLKRMKDCPPKAGPALNGNGTGTAAPATSEWQVFFPGVLYNTRTGLFYGYGFVNGKLTLTEGYRAPRSWDNTGIRYPAPPAPAGPQSGTGNSQNGTGGPQTGPGNSQSGGSSQTGAGNSQTSTGGAQTGPPATSTGGTQMGAGVSQTSTPSFQCTANTPTLRHEGLDELIADIPLSCTGTVPSNSSIGLRSNVPFKDMDLRYSFGSTPSTISGTPGYNGHSERFNLPDNWGKVSDFKMDFDVKYDLTPGYDHLNLRFRGSPGIDITPRDWTASITNNQFGGFTPSAGFVDTARYFWEHNRMPAQCTDTTTTTYVPRNDYGLTVTPLDSGLGFTPSRCNFNPMTGSMTLGGSNDFGFGGWRGSPAPNTPGGVYNSESGFQVTPNQSGGYLNGGWGQTPRNFLGGGFYNPLPFAFNRPQSYYDDNGPQSRFLIADPWNMKPSYCDYDFPDKLRAFPALAQALAAEARSRRPRESRASSEPGNAHFQVVSMRSSAPVSNSPSRAARPSQVGGGKPPQVQIEARVVEMTRTFTYSIVANGKSTGQTFELQVADPSGKVKTVAMRDGTVLEAIKPGVTQPVAASAGDAVVKQPLNGYCLEFHKPVPAEGTQYRIADQATQQKYASLHFLDRAAAQMAEKNEFHPDSDPDAYKNIIFQYAVWSKLEGWGEQEFTQHFVERTKQNAEDLHVPWTKEMENQLLAAAPGRWADISELMNQAQALEKASDERRNTRQSREQR
ncbi:MAG: hypothetical protein WA663_03645 [Candidatus Acidiferrales bacterium]